MLGLVKGLPLHGVMSRTTKAVIMTYEGCCMHVLPTICLMRTNTEDWLRLC